MKEHPLKLWRTEKQLSQEQAGECIGVDAMTISRWERGDNLPRRKIWPQFEEATGIAPSTMVEFMNREMTQ